MNYSLVTAPSTFPVTSRPIYVHPQANVTHKNKEEAYPLIGKALETIANKYPDSKVLVHTVSYELSKFLFRACEDRAITYGNSSERQRAIDQYLTTRNGILLASSLDRGIDLPGDDCRAIIVCKIPYPNLGDKQVSSRFHTKGGRLWYSVQTVRTLVQMTGRGMRSADDHCDSYILDKQFTSNIWKQNKNLLPKWWQEALVWAGPLKER